MGILDDISMGLGVKDRDEDYYERTAKTLGRTQGAGREATYRQSRAFKGKPKRAGLLSGFGGSSDGSTLDREQSRGLLPTLLGYRDMEDMFDRGGRYASGGMYQGAGGYSMLANLAHALSGQEFGDRKPYEVDIKNPTGTQSRPRPQLRPNNFMTEAQKEQVVMNQPVGNGYPDMSMPVIQGYTTPSSTPPAISAPTTQSIQTTAGEPSMGMTLDEYIMSQGVPVNEMTKEQYLPSYLQGYGISY